MKFLKKAVSALLASVMCIPSGILSFAAAEEENQVTTVTLSDTENGLMQFSEGCMESSTASQDGYHMMQVNADGEFEQIENDGSVWAFNYGNPVEIELLPDEGFHVKSFTIKNSSTGGIMSSKNTMDNVFSFTMPDESIIIEAEFSSSSTVNVVPDDQIRKEQDAAAGTGEESQKEPANNEESEDDGKNEEDGSGKNGGELNVTSMYHDITKEPEVSESEVEEAIFDLATESYIKANASPQYLSLDGTNEPVDVLQVKQTLFDGKYTQKEDTIDSVMSSIEYGDADMDESIHKFLGQIRSAVYVYNYSQDSDYYVAYANTMQRDEGYHVQDFAFAYNDNTGTALEGCIYDSSTGLLYIPKRFYEQISGKFKDDEGNIIIGSLQVQFMQVYSEPGSIQGRAAAYPNEEISVPDLQSNVCTVGADEDENSISVDNSNSSVFDLETITTVDAGMDADHMTVLVNGAPLSKEAYLYDSDTGELKLAISSAAIISIEAYENGETIKEQILDIVSDDADAVSFQNVTYDQMHSLGTIQINDKDRIPKKSNKNLFKPFQVKGELGYSANYSGMENYYISWNGAGGTALDTMQKQLAEYISGKSDSTSGFKPATIMDGSDMHIRSNLSAAVPARTADKWIEDKKGVNLIPFVRKIGNVPTHCAHITKAGFTNTLPAGTFAVRVVSIHDASEKTKNGVWTATGGYIILAFMSATICKQTTCEFVKVGFAGKAEEKESIDPLCFALVKDANTSRLDAGSPLTNAKLAGTRFKCDFYEDERFDSVGALKNSKKKATASWDFTAYKYAAKGSTKYQNFINDVLKSDDYSSSAYDLSGVDFFPKNFMSRDGVTPRKDWINNFIDKDDLSSWRSNFGKKGTYHVYETESGKGFLNEGKITDYYKSGISSNSTEDGMVVYFSADASKESVNKVLVNGQESSGSLLGTNKKEPGAPLYFKDRLDIIKLSSVASTAEGMESGEQVQTAEADSGPLRLYDKVIVTLFRENVDNATYYVTTSLYDKTDKKYLDVEWDTSGGGKVIEGVEESDDNFMVPSSIVHTFKASDAEITGDGNPPSYRLKVYGTIPTEGMEDHELVFMNSVYAIDNDKVEDEDMLDPGEDAEGFVKQLGALNTAFVKSEEDEASEYITFKKTEPGLNTSISDSEIKRKSGTGEAMTNAGPSRSLVDKISYNGLSSGKKYTVKGWLVDPETNDKFKDAGGTTVEVSEEKTAEGEIGSWDITFNFDATGFEGKKLVAFVEVYDGSELVFDHKDIDDLQETVIITKVTSELKDDDTQEHISAAGDVSLTDTISYENFIPGANYKINSRLVDAETGETATDKDGNEMKKETIVTADPRTGSGTFDVNLEFDIEAGDEAKFLVAYQDIQVENGADGSGDWVTVAEDEDAEDESQTVVVPSIKTFARDQKTDYNISFAEKNVNIYDTIHYEGLEPDQEYTVISKLVDKDTGDVVIDDDYKEQIIESTFVTKESFDTGKYGAYGDIIPGNHDGDGVTFSLNAESFAGKTLVIFEELYKDGKLIADHQDIADENQTIYFPKISTNAITDETQTSIALSGDGTSIIKDTVSYENLIPGLTYRIKGRVIDKHKTEEAGAEVVATGTDGKPAVNSVDFTPDSADGTKELTFDIDTSKYADDMKIYKGAVFVVFEELYVIQKYEGDDAESIVAAHTDISDETQTIYIPYITTTLLDTKTGLHIMYAESGACLVDTVSYYSCKPGMQFYVSGRLIDMETGKVLRDSAGNEAKIEYQQVTAEGSGDGTWELAYNIDASSIEGATVVAYAEVYIQGGKGEGGYTQVAVHNDFFDREERVYIPHIDTKAYDQDTVNHIAHADGSVYVVDEVTYDNIIPNVNYTLESELRWRNADGSDGGRVTDASGKEQFITTRFFADHDMTDDQYLTYGKITPDNSGGGIIFHFNAEDFDGKTVVVYERLYIEKDDGTKHLVADHQDITDEDQSIHFPKVWTDALDSETFTKTALADRMVTIVDTFKYENVLPGHTYELQGFLVDKNNTKRVDADKVVYVKDTTGGAVSNSKRFYSEGSAGTVELQFSFDATAYDADDWKGMVLVVYEYLYIVRDYLGDDSLALVGSHDDIDDPKQTIYIPYMTTTLLDTKTGLHIMYAEEDACLIDTVSYYKCLPGGTYYVSGRLIDMWTGNVLLDSNGNEVRIDYQQVTASSTGDGTWDLVYDFDASTLAGTTVVAYAEIYVKNPKDPSGYSPVAIHDEFFDPDERVYIPFISTTLLDQKTNSHYALAEKDVLLYDTVHYTDVMPGDYEYKFETELRDQATGEVVVDDAGRKLFLTTNFLAHFDMRDDQFATYGDVIPQNYEGSGITFEIDGEYFEDRTLVCYERLYIKGADGQWHIVADHQVLLDAEQTVHIGKGYTEALDSVTKTQTGMISKNTTIVDTFYYKNLNPDYTYELRGKVVEKNTTIATGTDVVVAENTVSNLNPDTSSGAWHNSFTFDTTKYNDPEYYGTVLVVYEYLYQIKRYDGADDELLIAYEEDINNASQTVWYPHIETELLDSTNGTHILSADEKAKLVDTVSYHNMQPNATYTLSGRLIDMESGKVITDAKGRRLEKTMEVMSSDNGDGTWDITYNFDASTLAGTLVVAYAEVYVKNGEDSTILSPVAIHNEFWDLDERVYIPIISTVATDQKTNSHISFAEDNMWVTDRVYYSYLQPDSQYRLISTLVDKDTGETVVDDKGILQRNETTFNTMANSSQEKYLQTISNPFTDSSDTGTGYAYGYVVPGDGTTLPDGSKPDGIVFTFDGGTFEGRTLVIYEELQIYKADGTWATVARHMDLDDENQTIHIPKVRTNAIDSETMTHLSKKDGSVTIIDTVTYENLIPGLTYSIEGCLMDKLRDDEKGSQPIKDADGHMITGTVTFTPKNPSGTEKVYFKGNVKDFQTDEGEFSSETLVVFEDLYLLNSKDSSNDKLKIAEHRDINDENQTIYFPRSKTKVMTYDLNGNPKQGDANHINGYAVYDCTYCKKSFLTEREAQNHINNTVLCKNKGASVKAVTEYTVYDTLYYENLIPGRTYQVVGTLIDTATGEAVLKGHTIVQSDTKYFTPGDKNGEVDVVFHIDGVDLAGGRYVVYEEVFLNGSSVTSHMDINDKDQMFNIIDMKTSAKDSTTGTNISTGNTISTIIDTVEMGPLVENEKYYLNAVLMDATKDSMGVKSESYGSYYKDATGEMVQGLAWREKGTDVWHEMSEPVTGPSYSRTGGRISIEVKFSVDTITEHGGKNYQGETYVLFEELRLENGEVVAQHKDLTDEQQTIQIGGMYTVAYDKDTGSNIMEADEGKTLYDTVYYSNLKPSSTYKVTTRIYVKEDSNMETGEYVEVTALNATNLVAASHVTSRSGTGSWTISASMPDLSKYAGKTLVVYEDIIDADGTQVVVENNLYNESQSIHLPKATTYEADDENGLHFTRSESKWLCSNDSCVTYTCNGCGLEFHSEDEAEKHLPDCWNRDSHSYTCTSGIFDTKAEAEKHTAPVYECDNCKIHFADEEDAQAHISGECKKATVLRANQLVRDENGNAVNELWYACSGCGAQFKTNQMCLEHINGSDICYTYTDINAEHNAFHNVNAKITDTVNYTNLIPGRLYRIDGWVYNAETGQKAVDAEGEEITASATFIPMSSRGSAELKFSFNASGMEGYKYAVYAEVYYTPSKTGATPVVVARHNENLKSADEAFYIPSVSTSAVDSYTETNVTLADTVTTVKDTVTFSGLKANEKYVLKGTIMDAATMDALVLPGTADKVTASKQFTAKATSATDIGITVADGIASGWASIDFTFSTSGLEGKTLVVFEELYLVQPKGDVIIGQHTEIMDEKQTTHIPMMRTYAYDVETNEQTAGADESVTLIDKVVLTNLVKGKRYKLAAALMDPVTGKVMQDANGHDITGTLDVLENSGNNIFTASTSGRTVKNMKFVFDGSNLAGKTAVVWETLYMEGERGSYSVIAQHNPLPDANYEGADMDYLNQSISFPKIGTTAKDADTNTIFTKAGRSTIIDTVSYENLTAGLEYKMVGTIYDIKSGTVLADTLNDSYTVTKYFTPDASGNGTVDLEFSFSTKDMAGRTFVVFEELYLNDVLIAEHKDPDDLKQTIMVPKIGTKAVSEDLGLQMTFADDDAVIIDTVSYENLIPDREYTVKGKLMDKKTGKPLLDYYGDEITGETTFTPELSHGTVDVQFRFNAAKMEGIIAVAYEELFYLDASIADHKDIHDEEQTVYFPKAWSVAKGNETDYTHVGPADSIMTITDTVYYENFLGDREYHIRGVVMDAETGEPAVDANGDEVVEEKTFTTAHPDADSASKAVSGFVDVVFTFDATGMRGKTLVIYEYIYYHKTTTSYLDYQIAEHAVQTDELQMIHIPEIGTTAWDSETKHHITKADDDATMIDTVAYKNLVPGLEYTLDAYLIDLDENGEIAKDDYGQDITGTTTFVPKDWNGTVDVRFNDREITGLAGHTLVAFEFLYYKDTLIEHHDNPEDEAQTIHIPKIATHARSFESDSHNSNTEAYINVVDEIEYWNLVPGLEYTAIGVIVNKKTGQPAIDAEGNYIKGSTTFTPDESDGTVDVVFTFDSTGMEDTDLVVFEEIFYKGDLPERASVAEHSDLLDEEQSVSIPKISNTMLMDTKTGLKMALAEDSVELTDTISYKGLYPGTQYEIVGKLYNAETKEPVRDKNNEEVVGVLWFTPEEKQGQEEITFEFSGLKLEGITLAAYTELYVVKDGDELSLVAKHNEKLTDKDEMVSIPKARTTAADKDTSINYSEADKTITLVDTITYEGLIPGYAYTATGVLVDKKTQNPVTDSNGNEITAETSFVAHEADGTVNVTFTFDAEGFAGKTYNVFETITCNGKVVAEHKDPNDEDQDMHFTKVSTNAFGTETGVKMVLAEDASSVTDTVYYENLKPGEEYTVTGKLFNAGTGEPVLDPSVNVNPYEVLDITEYWVCDKCGELFFQKEDATAHITGSETCDNFTLVLSYDEDEYKKLLESAQLKAEKTFTAESSDGSIDLVYELNTKPLAGKSVVATAVITYKGVQIGSHEDLNDKDETVNVPEIGTMAVDKENGMHVSNPDETITIVDTVEYKNLTAGMEYTMSGYLIDKATGEAALDDKGNRISSETVFTAEQADGTVEVVFTFDGKNLAGHSLVAFESLSVNTELKPVVAEHKDPEDEEQTVDIPEIKTTASDASTNSNIIKAGENTTVIDRVYYHNLDSGKTYTIRGVLIDKATGKPIVDESGNEITASKEFTVKQPDGYTDIEFTFNAADHMGKTLVAFEELILKGHVIETHKDPDDEDQTVYVPKVGTTATDKKTGTHTALAEGKITIVDKVAYSNIAPGEDYKLIGTLVDAETGKTLEGPVETSFKAEAESGTAEVEFVVDSEILKGKKAVVFEELQARAVTSVKESEIYVCSQCGKEFTSKTYVLWHFEDSEECSEYTVTFKTVKEYGDFITIAEHKDLADKGQTVYVPEIRTTAKDAETNTKLSYADDKTVIIDTVHYESLELGTEYEMTGTLMDKETGKPVEENGKPVTSSVKFTPEAESGDIDITFTFDSTEYAGKALVAYENLTADGKPVAKHENPDDEDQTVYIPEIGTTALDKTTDDHIGPVGKTIIVDTVAYHNLIPGLSYTVKGTLMDKTTGKPYETGTDDGKDKTACTAETVFTAKEPDGTVDLVFEVETSKNLTLVAFEELFYEGKLIADHKDIDDEGQSVNYPEIRTHAANKETGGHTIPASGMATIVDTVTYENLIPGKEYTINGELMDKETGKGTGYTSSITFTPDKPSGSVQLEFKVNAADLAGSAVVAFETLYYKGKELTSHADITDKDQTIDIPEIRTHAKDEQTQMHVVSLGEKIKIMDTVTYKGLTPGTEYTMRGTLMLKGESGAESTGITAEKKFVPDEPDGSVELEFIVDSTKYAGMSLVAYEKLFDKNTEIADHENPDDEDQTVHVPEIGTKASINDAASSADATEIVDVVRYKNLVPGMSYTLSGKLIDKATGKELGITASKAFTPETPDGEVSMLFKINPEMLKDHSVVVFETLMLNDIIVAKHEDINDRDQTVSNRKIATHAVDKETGTKVVTLGEKVIVLDTVTYEGLVPGTEYTMTGTLMLKKANGPVESTGITASKKFVPVKPDGEVTLEFTVDSTKYAGMSLVAYEKLFDKDVEIANHENPDDEDQTVYVPEIRTTASIGGKKESTASKNTIITDTVSYHNLVPGIEYTMTGVLMDKETGKPTGFASSAVFTPSEADGKIDMEFHIDASGFAGKHLVVFEKLKIKDVTVAEHEDINDKDQTVDITPEKPEAPEPSIRTLAQISGKKSAVVSTLTSVTDTVSYTNLVKGRKYIMKGVLMVKDTNSALVVNGKEVSAEKEFTAESESGSVELEFIFDSSALAGTSLVAFETLYADGSITAEHKDINDEDQTVHLVEKPGPDSPSIRTAATVDGEKQTQASAETVITDTVTYKNLRIGMKYTMKGVLMDKSTEKPLLINGKKVTSEAVFTPQAKDGSISMTFTFDSSSMTGSSIVVFEELYANNDLVASHEDIGDKDQTVNIVKIPEQPFIMTYAEINGEKSSAAGKSATITDKVTYHNLTPGTEYTLKGVLMNKASGKELFVNGKKVTAETKFKPAKADGTVDMKFVFDSSALGGTSVVVFEDLYIGSTLAASHHDINDEDQTVEITKPSSTPEIRTYADINGRKSAAASTRTTITDKVSYKGLVPGKRYTLTGFLMNKASGKKLSYGGKVITSTVSFTPQKPEGSVEMKFSFDSSNCAGMSIVVFEYLYADGSPVASHENLNDEDQTVFITKPSPVTPVPDTPVPVNPSVPNPDTPKTPVKVKTGDSYFAVAALFAAAVVILSAAIIILRKKED